MGKTNTKNTTSVITVLTYYEHNWKFRLCQNRFGLGDKPALKIPSPSDQFCNLPHYWKFRLNQTSFWQGITTSTENATSIRSVLESSAFLKIPPQPNSASAEPVLARDNHQHWKYSTSVRSALESYTLLKMFWLGVTSTENTTSKLCRLLWLKTPPLPNHYSWIFHLR
jgi:hypothetical protein